MGNTTRGTLGILGGSFDPIHLGHVELARSAVRDGRVDEIVFVPAACAPMRQSAPLAGGRHRLEMLKLALKRFEYPYSISEFELARGGISYAVDTVKYLSATFPAKSFKWIIGADHLEKLRGWREIETISKTVSFLCAVRGGFENGAKSLPPFVKVDFFKFEPVPYSSTEIRKLLSEGKRRIKMLDPEVERYILLNRLYNT